MATQLLNPSKVTYFLFVLLFVFCSSEDDVRVCEEITIPMCRGIGYNYTYMPNPFKHDTQDEAGMEVHQFWPLVEIQCSPDLKFFLCSMYAPICMTNYHKPLPACRSVCERARSGCAPLMRQYGFAWPERMQCSELPQYGDKDQLCMDFNLTERNTAGPPRPTNFHPAMPTSPSSTQRNCDCTCRAPMVQIHNQSSPYYNRLKTGRTENCAMGCEGAYF